MTEPLYSVETVPLTSQNLMREFVDRYVMGADVQEANDWSILGDRIPGTKGLVTVPVSTLTTRYQKTVGDSRFDSPGEDAFDIKSEEFDAGVTMKLYDVIRGVFGSRKWLKGPQRLLLEKSHFVLRQLAALLELGASTPCWDGENFFSATHPVNKNNPDLGQYSNYQATPKSVLDITKIEEECVLFQENAVDENGDRVESTPDTILVPTAKNMPLTNVLGQAFVANSAGTATMNNPFYGGRFNVVHVPQFSDTNDWMLLDSKRIARDVLPPWLVIEEDIPPELALRLFDAFSEYCKTTGFVKVSSHIWMGFALAFPNCIRLVKGTG